MEVDAADWAGEILRYGRFDHSKVESEAAGAVVHREWALMARWQVHVAYE